MVKSSGGKAYFVIIIIAIVVVVLAGLIWWNFKAQRVANLPPAPPTTESAVEKDTL